MTTPVLTVEPPLVEPKAAPINEQEAVATVEEVLGGTVVDAASEQEGSTTHVVVPDDANQAVEQPSLPEEPAEVAGNGTITVACGALGTPEAALLRI